MFTVTVPRPEVTNEEIAEALRQGLGPKYHVLADPAVNWNPVGHPRPDHPGTVVVGIGSSRLFRAQVSISHDSGPTILRVTPGGIGPILRLTNTVWIARKVRDAMRNASSLHELVSG